MLYLTSKVFNDRLIAGNCVELVYFELKSKVNAWVHRMCSKQGAKITGVLQMFFKSPS